MNTTEQINSINLCRAFIAKRPGLDPRNYIRDGRDSYGRALYISESRRITQQLNDARRLLRYCELNGVDLNAQLIHRDRLHFDANGALEYHVGQYWPTEYRAAVARVAAVAIWYFWRDQCNIDTGDKLRATARAEFGRGIASRWFN
jgi:hypothetical protein